MFINPSHYFFIFIILECFFHQILSITYENHLLYLSSASWLLYLSKVSNAIINNSFYIRIYMWNNIMLINKAISKRITYIIRV